MEVINVCFLLIQGEVVDVADRPDALNFAFVDKVSGFQVAIACVNEHGEREVVQVIAEVQPMVGCSSCRISSAIDGAFRLVGNITGLKYAVRTRLRLYWEGRRFDDLCKLPQPILVEGEK